MRHIIKNINSLPSKKIFLEGKKIYLVSGFHFLQFAIQNWFKSHIRQKLFKILITLWKNISCSRITVFRSISIMISSFLISIFRSFISTVFLFWVVLWIICTTSILIFVRVILFLIICGHVYITIMIYSSYSYLSWFTFSWVTTLWFYCETTLSQTF